jgi:hypothetical protein
MFSWRRLRVFVSVGIRILSSLTSMEIRRLISDPDPHPEVTKVRFRFLHVLFVTGLDVCDGIPKHMFSAAISLDVGQFSS